MAMRRIMRGDPGFVTRVRRGAQGCAGRGAQILPGGARGRRPAPPCAPANPASVLSLPLSASHSRPIIAPAATACQWSVSCTLRV